MRLGEAQRLVQHTNSLNPDMPMLVIDLGTVAQEEGFVKSVETIVAARPWLTTVALTCCGNRDDQTKALFRCLWSGFPRPILHALPAILSDFPSILSDFPRRLPSFEGFRPAVSNDRECVL